MQFCISDNKRSNCEYSKNLALCLQEKGRRVSYLCIQTITSGVLSIYGFMYEWFIITEMFYDHEILQVTYKFRVKSHTSYFWVS